ncbi:MAG: hypothetical protein CVU89_12935 [Firmicutes bacterium HGW-Firmicutes-14]|nr:MAG: hypothetical protein CVU89_12935 [Firmicutes bacterium HGW-Firmicutes-14]
MTENRCVVDTFSREEFDRLEANFSEVRKLIEEGGKAVSQFPYLLQDIFFALFNEFPVMLPPDKVSTGARLNRLVIGQLFKNREFRRIREFTKGDAAGAGMAAMYYGELLLQSLDHVIKDTVNEIFVSEEELYDAVLQKKVAEKIALIAGGHKKKAFEKQYTVLAGQWEKLAGDKRKHLLSLAARLNLLWNTSGNKNVATSGGDEKGDKEGRFETGGEGQGTNKGVWTRGDISAHLKLVETYITSPRLKRLAEKVGRLREVREQRKGRAVPEDIAEVTGIDYGNDLSLVVPEEWLDYFHPVKRAGFRKRYADESLCLYDIKGKRRKGRGSLIICLDNSGSMQGPKEETSKAVAIALMEIAAAQKRDFILIMFGGPDDDLRVFEVPKGKCTTEQLIEIGEHFLCSAGTDFEKPLQEAVQYLEKDKYQEGDIVFITDGVCNVSPGFLAGYKDKKKAMQFRTIAVLVNYGNISTAPVEAFCDELLFSKDLKGLDVAAELFGSLGKG